MDNAFKLSKNEIEQEFSDCENLQQLISEIENGLWNQKSVLCQISVNGEWLSEEMESGMSNRDISEITEVQYQAKPLLKLVNENIVAIIDWLESARVAIHTSIELLDQGKIKEFNSYMLSIYEGCQWFIDSLTFLKTPITQLDFNIVDEENWQQLTDEFMQTIKECVLAFEAQDTQMVVDLMEYNLIENFDKWLVLLNKQDKIIGGND